MAAVAALATLLSLVLTAGAVRADAAPGRSGDGSSTVDAVRGGSEYKQGSRTTRRPRLDADLRSVLTLVNRARSKARVCGTKRYPAVAPVKLNARLNVAADGFAHLMARRDFFAHESPNGASPGDRIARSGYDWSRYGENIAAGYSDPASVVDAWLKSPGHCANLMGRFKEIGLGYAYDPDSTYGHYWVQDFATRG
ncbi:CAP domain-containing protein [Nocardioides marinquilinus]|uniref:CAP domain-containing protein n=1 Tax=Nocardioides marinquilinus TaxID=1210400 RepID=UPI0031ED847F